MTRTAKLLLLPVLLLQILFFSFVAQHRFIDGDEGSFLLASRLVLQHKTPYLDFFYQQTPLLPYVYALWMKCFQISWTAGRLLSSLLTALLGVLLYQHVCRQTRSWLAGLSAVVLFASSILVFAWFPVVKTHSLAGLLLFSAYVVVSRLSTAFSPWIMAAGGLLLGLSVDTRSYLLLLTPVFLWWIFRNFDAGTRLASIRWFLGGFTVGIAPCLFFFLRSPDVFLFDNLRYHALRSSEGLIGWWQEKLVVAVQLFLGARENNGLQWSILFFVSLGFVFSIPGRRPPRLAFQIAIVLAIICLLPTPAYPQYFCLCVPFLIMSAVCGVNELITHLESRREKLVAAVACVSVLAIYLAVSVKDFRNYLGTGDGVPGVQPAHDRGDWRLQRVIEVSRAIDEIAAPGEIVASFWPGDLFQTRAEPLPGLENPFALPVSEKLNAQQRVRYHIISPAEIEADFVAHQPRVVVLRDQLAAVTSDELKRMQQTGDAFRSTLHAQGYTLVRSIGGISIYVCPLKS